MDADDFLDGIESDLYYDENRSSSSESDLEEQLYQQVHYASKLNIEECTEADGDRKVYPEITADKSGFVLGLNEANGETVNEDEKNGEWNIGDSSDQKKSRVTRYYLGESLPNIYCYNCDLRGHIARDCELPKKEPICHLCGGAHMRSSCKNDVCYNCMDIGHISKNCKQPRSSRNTYKVCSRCQYQGHIKKNCTELWRQFHMTVKDGFIVKPKRQIQNKVRYCYNCASMKHFGEDCSEERYTRRSYYSQFIVSYDKCPVKSSSFSQVVESAVDSTETQENKENIVVMPDTKVAKRKKKKRNSEDENIPEKENEKEESAKDTNDNENEQSTSTKRYNLRERKPSQSSDTGVLESNSQHTKKKRKKSKEKTTENEKKTTEKEAEPGEKQTNKKSKKRKLSENSQQPTDNKKAKRTKKQENSQENDSEIVKGLEEIIESSNTLPSEGKKKTKKKRKNSESYDKNENKNSWTEDRAGLEENIEQLPTVNKINDEEIERRKRKQKRKLQRKKERESEDKLLNGLSSSKEKKRKIEKSWEELKVPKAQTGKSRFSILGELGIEEEKEAVEQKIVQPTKFTKAEKRAFKGSFSFSRFSKRVREKGGLAFIENKDFIPVEATTQEENRYITKIKQFRKRFQRNQVKERNKTAFVQGQDLCTEEKEPIKETKNRKEYAKAKMPKGDTLATVKKIVTISDNEDEDLHCVKSQHTLQESNPSINVSDDDDHFSDDEVPVVENTYTLSTVHDDEEIPENEPLEKSLHDKLTRYNPSEVHAEHLKIYGIIQPTIQSHKNKQKKHWKKSNYENNKFERKSPKKRQKNNKSHGFKLSWRDRF